MPISPRHCLLLLIAVATLLPDLAAAACGPYKRSSPAEVRINADAMLVVTHASARYDARLSTKRGVDSAVRFAKSKGLPVLYLEDGSPAEFQLPDDCNPDHWLHSEEGELPVDFRGNQVYVAGGHLEVCLANTLVDVMDRWARQPRRDLTITYFMDAIYSNGKEVADSDPWQRDFANFLSVVTYGRPATSDWPKVALLETMGIIVSESRQFDYLERIVPHHSRFFGADYRVEIGLNDRVRVIQQGRGSRPPVLRFQFLDSAAGTGPQGRTVAGSD
jgi:hypothetical protein